MKINKALLNKLKDSELDLEELFLLYTLVNEPKGLTDYVFKPASWYKLSRLGLVELDGNEVTDAGYSLLAKFNLIVINPNKINMKEAFEEWWKEFPSYDDHGQGARTRRIKTNKTTTEQKYRDAVNDGFAPQFLLKALKADVQFYIKNSTKENKLKYFPNPARWLYQREFESYEDITSPEEDINTFVEYGKEID